MSVDPQAFGATGDGATDDTAALTRALEATRNGARLTLAHRAYRVRSLDLQPGMGGIVGPGRLLNGGAADAVLSLRGEAGASARPIERVLLSEIEIETNEAHVAVLLQHAGNCRIEHCRISRLHDGHVGIQLQTGCAHTLIRNNRIDADVSHGSIVCVEILSPTAPNIAGFFTPPGGRICYLGETTHSNVVEGNVIVNGTHGVAVGGAAHTRIVNNTITGSTHRNINLCPASRHNLVSGNALLDAGSSAVAMAYGASFNIVANNSIRSFATVPDVDRDAIHAYVNCAHNLIAGNRIDGDFRYGVYLAVNAAGNVVQDNLIALARKADLDDDFCVGVGLESDWPERPLPAGALYSRRNFGSALPLAWGYVDSVDNVIRNNHVSGATCGVYLAQLGRACGLGRNIVRGNSIAPPFHQALYLHCDADARMFDNALAEV